MKHLDMIFESDENVAKMYHQYLEEGTELTLMSKMIGLVRTESTSLCY